MEVRTTFARPSQAARPSILRRLIAFTAAHPVWASFLLALAIRVGVAIAITLVLSPQHRPRWGPVSALAAAKASGHTGGWGPYEHFLYHGTATLLLPLTWLDELFGVHQLVAQLWVTLFGAGTADADDATRDGALPERGAAPV